MIKKLNVFIIFIGLLSLFNGCSQDPTDNPQTTSEVNLETSSEVNSAVESETYYESSYENYSEKLIGSFDSDLGESMVSEMHLNTDKNIIVSYSEDMGAKYNYNITINEKTTEKLDDLKTSADTNFNNMSAEVSLRGTNIIVKDTSTDEVINQIPTHLNFNSTPSEFYFNLESHIAIDVYNDYIYMVNENGIFRAKYNDREFTCMLASSDVRYLDIDNYKDFADKIYPINQVMRYEIFVISENEIFISTSLGDDIGYGYIKYYVEYELG